jgi:membrane protease YdiL (CAAX protease family)
VAHSAPFSVKCAKTNCAEENFVSTLQTSLPIRGLPDHQVQTTWWGHLVWVLAAAALGWAEAAIFAGMLHLSRNLFLVPYALLTTIFLIGYLRWGRFDLRHLLDNWRWGLVGALLVGAFVVNSVLQQPRTPTPQGINLVFNLVWLGLIYGLVDGLLLSVLPIVATWQAFTTRGWTDRWPGRVGAGIAALIASLLVTATYHLGYPEFQGLAVLWPMLGVGVMSLAYLLSRSPLAPVLSHIAMHVAAVLVGLQTAIQLPPHY